MTKKNISRDRRVRSNKKYLERQDGLISKLPIDERVEFEFFQQAIRNKCDYFLGETWKPIKEWEDLYLISSFGRIKYKLTGRIKTPALHHSNYYFTALFRNKQPKYYILSRLLAINFIDNPYNLPEVNHINKIRIDFRLKNLEWASSADNQKHKMEVDCFYDSRVKIIQYDKKTGEYIRHWASISEAARSVGGQVGNILTVLNGKNHYAYNSIWRYAK